MKNSRSYSGKGFTKALKTAIIVAKRVSEVKLQYAVKKNKQRGSNMAITAISSVKLGNTNNTAFQGRKHHDEEIPAGKAPRQTGSLAKVPVIVMLAMSPINASSGQPQIAALNSDALTELVAANAPEPIVNNVTQSRSNRPEVCSPEKIVMQKSFVSGGKEYTMYYTDFYATKDKKANTWVTAIYFVPKDYKVYKFSDGTDINTPPELVGLRFHDVGKGKEFVGAIVEEQVYDPRNTKRNKDGKTDIYRREIRLPDDIGDGLWVLYEGSGKFQTPQRGRIARCFEQLQQTTSSELLPNEYVESIYFYKTVL